MQSTKKTTAELAQMADQGATLDALVVAGATETDILGGVRVRADAKNRAAQKALADAHAAVIAGGAQPSQG